MEADLPRGFGLSPLDAAAGCDIWARLDVPAVDEPPRLTSRVASVRQIHAEGANPWLEAAGLLLRALADLQLMTAIPEAGLEALHGVLAQELRTFTLLCQRAGLRHEHMLAVRYVLCTALDEALNCKPWAGGDRATVGPWSQNALLQEFHQEGAGGQTVFLLIGRLAQDAQAHREVLEVMAHVLALGFMGDYRTQPDGTRSIEHIRDRLHGLLETPVQASPALSPPAPPEASRTRRFVPGLRAAVCAALSLLAGVYTWHASHLRAETDALRQRIAALRVDWPHAADAPTQPELALQGLRHALGSDISAGRLWVENRDGNTVVGLRDGMFASAQANLDPQWLPLLKRVAAAVTSADTALGVYGHSDGRVLRSNGAYADNRALSLQRARVVVQALRQAEPDLPMAVAYGCGAARPLADDASPEGQARNRRVEIVLRRGQGVSPASPGTGEACPWP